MSITFIRNFTQNKKIYTLNTKYVFVFLIGRYGFRIIK
jgi:hypothetical protein